MKNFDTPKAEEEEVKVKGTSLADLLTTFRKYLLWFFFTLIFLIMITRTAMSQSCEVGVLTGMSTFFGDLGGANDIGRPLFFDFEASQVRPVIGGIVRVNLNRHIAWRNNVFYTKIGGDDKLIQPSAVFANEWFRWYRNLNFKSTILEASSMIEVNMMPYDPMHSHKNFTPFVFGGIGVFHFDPTTEFNGQTVHLQPLHTEGQGFSQYPDRQPYHLTQMCIPWGFGLRYAANEYLNIGLEYGDRYTFTDYIDDVSSNYVSQTEIQQYFHSDPATADLAWALSVRSDELDPEGIYSVTTAPYQQRGNPKNKDQYIFAYVLSFTYTLHDGFNLFNHPHHHGHMDCPIFASF